MNNYEFDENDIDFLNETLSNDHDYVYVFAHACYDRSQIMDLKSLGVVLYFQTEINTCYTGDMTVITNNDLMKDAYNYKEDNTSYNYMLDFQDEQSNTFGLNSFGVYTFDNGNIIEHGLKDRINISLFELIQYMKYKLNKEELRLCLKVCRTSCVHSSTSGGLRTHRQKGSKMKKKYNTLKRKLGKKKTMKNKKTKNNLYKKN